MKKINISQVDTIFVNGSYPIEFLLYYKNRLKTKKIRSGLKRLSSSFWPVFGEYEAGIIHFDRYSERDCFDEIITEQEFSSKETNTNFYEQYNQIMPSDLKKLFFLKMIQYKNGTVLIPKLNHLAGDGYSYFYFLSVLAALCQDSYISLKKYIIQNIYKPRHRRTILKEFQFPEMKLISSPIRGNLTFEFEEIAKTEVQNIIKNIGSESNQRVSANDILSAMVIQKSVELQKEYFGETIQLTIPIDVRRQIREYGSKYFGNGLMFNVINLKTDGIENSSLDKIAIEIRKNMPAVNKESYLKFLGDLEAIIARGEADKLRPYDPETGCLVTNLSRLSTHKLNFGTGGPDFIFPLTTGKNAAAILADKKNFILRLVY